MRCTANCDSGWDLPLATPNGPHGPPATGSFHRAVSSPGHARRRSGGLSDDVAGLMLVDSRPYAARPGAITSPPDGSGPGPGRERGAAILLAAGAYTLGQDSSPLTGTQFIQVDDLF